MFELQRQHAQFDFKWVSDGVYPLPDMSASKPSGQLPESATAHGPICHRVAFHLPADRPFPTGFRLEEERFTCGSGPDAALDLIWRPRSQQIELVGKTTYTTGYQVKFDGQESLLLQSQRMLKHDELRSLWPQLSPIAEQWVADMTAQRAVRCGLFDAGKIAIPIAAVAEERYVASDGCNLANVLRHIEQTHVDGLQPIATALADLVRDLERVIVYDGGGNQRWIKLQFKDATAHGQRQIDLWELSDGTIQALTLATLLFSPEQPRLITIDEPELNLHSAWIRRFCTWMSEAPTATQPVVTTHSPELLDALTDAFVAGRANVLVFGQAGSTSIEVLQPDALKAQLEAGWQLGDLYRVGDQSVGGWPW